MKKALLFLILTLCTLTLSAQESRMFRKGYRGSVEIGNYAIFGKDIYGGIAQLTVTQGYSFGNGAFVGLGIGVGIDPIGESYIPFYMDAKYNFIDGQVSPFASVRTGMRLGISRSFQSFNIDLGGGVDFGRFSIKLGYEFATTCALVVDSRYGHSWSMGKPSMLFCSFAFNF
jgi:hypothetical protein